MSVNTPWVPGKNHLDHKDVIPEVSKHVMAASPDGRRAPAPECMQAITRHLQLCLADSTTVVDQMLQTICSQEKP